MDDDTARAASAADAPSWGIALDERADIARFSVMSSASALRREFFGGIWFKVFTERGPSLIALF